MMLLLSLCSSFPTLQPSFAPAVASLLSLLRLTLSVPPPRFVNPLKLKVKSVGRAAFILRKKERRKESTTRDEGDLELVDLKATSATTLCTLIFIIMRKS